MSQQSTDSYPPQSSLRENAWGAAFLLILLIVSGATATIVGYRVKVADMARKDELRQRYEALGGSRETLYQVGHSLGDSRPPSESLDKPSENFIAVYELNERIRMNGLASTLAGMNPQQKAAAIRGLQALDMTTAADAVAAEGEGSPEHGRAPAYNRKVIRAVEIALARYSEKKS
jgi:hypothetical protein